MDYWIVCIKYDGVNTSLADIDRDKVVMGWSEKDCPDFYNGIKQGDVIIAVDRSHINCRCHYVGYADILDRNNQSWSLKSSTTNQIDYIAETIQRNAEELSGGRSKNPWGSLKSILKLKNSEKEKEIKMIADYALSDYEFPVSFIKDYAGESYSDPTKAATAEQRDKMQAIKNAGARAFYNFNIISSFIAKRSGYKVFKLNGWTNRSSKVRPYFWSEFKKEDRIGSNISISLFVVREEEHKVSYSVALALTTKNASKEDKNRFVSYRHVDLPEGFGFRFAPDKAPYYSKFDKDNINDDNYLNICAGRIIESNYEKEIFEAIRAIEPVYCQIVPGNIISSTYAAGGAAMNPFIEEARNLLLKKKNLILQGAPGTGKTYNTAAIAVAVADPSFNEWNSRDAVMKRYTELRDKEHLIDFVTFHQSLDYETFIRGIRPVPFQTEDGTSVMTYPIVDGIFLKMCTRAKQKKDTMDIASCIDNFIKTIQDNPIQIRNASNSGMTWIWTKTESEVFFMRGGKCEKPDPNTDRGTMWPNIEKVKGQASLDPGVFENNWKSQAHAIIQHVKEQYGLEIAPDDNIEEADKVVLIIDEINRGNISRIFGELITLIEADKRLGTTNGLTVSLPYEEEGDKPFGVPANLYILGTMNTTDRSTGSIDYALRRRFAFITVKADESLIENNESADEETRRRAVKLFNAIKSFLGDKNQSRADMDVEDLMVGHSYFMAENLEELQDSFKYEILPLIWEYQKDGIIGVPEDVLENRVKGWNRILNGQSEQEEKVMDDTSDAS